jgi:hypothetical protein
MYEVELIERLWRVDSARADIKRMLQQVGAGDLSEVEKTWRRVAASIGMSIPSDGDLLRELAAFRVVQERRLPFFERMRRKFVHRRDPMDTTLTDQERNLLRVRLTSRIAGAVAPAKSEAVSLQPETVALLTATAQMLADDLRKNDPQFAWRKPLQQLDLLIRNEADRKPVTNAGGLPAPTTRPVDDVLADIEPWPGRLLSLGRLEAAADPLSRMATAVGGRRSAADVAVLFDEAMTAGGVEDDWRWASLRAEHAPESRPHGAREAMPPAARYLPAYVRGYETSPADGDNSARLVGTTFPVVVGTGLGLMGDTDEKIVHENEASAAERIGGRRPITGTFEPPAERLRRSLVDVRDDVMPAPLFEGTAVARPGAVLEGDEEAPEHAEPQPAAEARRGRRTRYALGAAAVLAAGIIATAIATNDGDSQDTPEGPPTPGPSPTGPLDPGGPPGPGPEDEPPPGGNPNALETKFRTAQVDAVRAIGAQLLPGDTDVTRAEAVDAIARQIALESDGDTTEDAVKKLINDYLDEPSIETASRIIGIDDHSGEVFVEWGEYTRALVVVVGAAAPGTIALDMADADATDKKLVSPYAYVADWAGDVGEGQGMASTNTSDILQRTSVLVARYNTDEGWSYEKRQDLLDTGLQLSLDVAASVPRALGD